jgi:hypothetical protein
MPNSDEELSAMPFEELAQVFAAAVVNVKVDQSGVWCRQDHAETLSSVAHAVQRRTTRSDGEREWALGMLATITRIMLDHPAMQRRTSGAQPALNSQTRLSSPDGESFESRAGAEDTVAEEP